MDCGFCAFKWHTHFLISLSHSPFFRFDKWLAVHASKFALLRAFWIWFLLWNASSGEWHITKVYTNLIWFSLASQYNVTWPWYNMYNANSSYFHKVQGGLRDIFMYHTNSSGARNQVGYQPGICCYIWIIRSFVCTEETGWCQGTCSSLHVRCKESVGVYRQEFIVASEL